MVNQNSITIAVTVVAFVIFIALIIGVSSSPQNYKSLNSSGSISNGNPFGDIMPSFTPFD